MYKPITSEEQVKTGVRVRRKSTGEEHTIGNKLPDGRFRLLDKTSKSYDAIIFAGSYETIADRYEVWQEE